MGKIGVKYQKVYTDDTGKHMLDIFGDDDDVVALHIKKFWTDIVDGFYFCKNSNVKLMAIDGNCRVVVDKGTAFEEYYLTGMDGKTVKVPSGHKYAVQNLDEGKTTILIGTSVIDPDFAHCYDVRFNWKKRKG